MNDSENNMPAAGAIAPNSSPEEMVQQSVNRAPAPHSTPEEMIPPLEMPIASAPPLTPEIPIASAPPLTPEIPIASAPPLTPPDLFVPSAPPMSIRSKAASRRSIRRKLKVYDVISISVERGIDEFIRAVNARIANTKYVPVGGVTIDKDKNVYLQSISSTISERLKNTSRRRSIN